MNYYLDTEFIEGTQLKRVPFFNIPYAKTKPTIDLISIGIVSENSKEYYTISKDFNLKEAWNRYDLKKKTINHVDISYKEYWIRDNILKLIFNELSEEHESFNPYIKNLKFTYKNFKYLLNKYGKTNKQIVKEIKRFINLSLDFTKKDIKNILNPSFYAYYCNYDWVVFCWLFGKMLNLPKGFPMYCNDLKILLEDAIYKKSIIDNTTIEETKNIVKHSLPINKTPHNALSDAKYDRDLHNLINQIYEQIKTN